MRPNSALQICVAFASIASNTGSNSPGELLMTLSTSAVAVCCSSDSRNSLRSRVFSMAMTACAAKLDSNCYLLVAEWAYLLPIDADRADQLVLLEHWYKEVRSSAGGFHKGHHAGLARDITGLGREVGNVDDAPGCGEGRERILRISVYMEDRLPAPSLGIGRRGVLLGNNTK